MNFDYNALQGTKEIKTFIPYSLTEAEEIIKYLKNYPLIVNLSKLKGGDAQRLLDLLTGAICALDKNVCVLDKDNYLFLKK